MPDVTQADFIRNPARFAHFAPLGRVCRLGLATRGNTHLEPEAVFTAIERGVNYLNWCGHADGLSRAVRAMTAQQRSKLYIAVQLSARDAGSAKREVSQYLGELGTDYLDVVTYYYVEHEDEWRQIISPGGAAEALEQARTCRHVRAIGLTSHQRLLAAETAASGRLDMLMIRYNAAHRGAESQIFPITTARRIPVVAFTAQRWGALMQPTPDDSAGFVPPGAGQWYRFVLCQPAVTVTLMAPDGTEQLHRNLQLLDDWQGMSCAEYANLCRHGDRVRQHAGRFP